MNSSGLSQNAPSSRAPPRAEDSLRSSEIRYRRLFEAARDGILILDPGTRKITDANPFMTELLGYTHEELLGRELWEIGLWKDEEASQTAFRELQEKGYIRYEDLPLKTKEGQRREVEFVSNLYQEDAGNVIQCNIRDITERKHAEQALRAAKNEISRHAIVLTSSQLGPDIDMAYRLGANSYLVKPSPDKLSEMISAIKQSWLDLNEPAAECLEFAGHAATNN